MGYCESVREGKDTNEENRWDPFEMKLKIIYLLTIFDTRCYCICWACGLVDKDQKLSNYLSIIFSTSSPYDSYSPEAFLTPIIYLSLGIVTIKP